MDLSIDPVFGFTSRLLLMLVFGAAVMHKLSEPRRFIAVLREYRLLPAAVITPAALTVICAEAFVVLGIWWQASRGWAAAVAVTLLVTYSVAIGINVRRGRIGIDCGCSFGAARQRLSLALCARNALLLLPCAVAGLATKHALEVTGLVTGLLGAVALGLCYQVWGALAANRPRVLLLEGPK